MPRRSSWLDGSGNEACSSVGAKRVASSTIADPAGGGTGQSGDQSTADTGSASETPGAESPETGAGSESAPANDGPGGHADPAGNANADHQFQGNE